jgi:hypothetical protein
MAKTSEQQNGSPKGSKALIIVGIVLIILLIFVVVLLLSRGSADRKEEIEEKEENKRSSVINEDNARDVIGEMLESKDVKEDTSGIDYYSATMNYEWRFPSGTDPSSNAYIENNTDNTKDVYFDLFITGDEEHPIYESPIIPVGSSLSGFSLSEDLDAGTYDCVCVYHLVDNEQNTLSTLRVKVTIIVEA